MGKSLEIHKPLTRSLGTQRLPLVSGIVSTWWEALTSSHVHKQEKETACTQGTHMQGGSLHREQTHRLSSCNIHTPFFIRLSLFPVAFRIKADQDHSGHCSECNLLPICSYQSLSSSYIWIFLFSSYLQKYYPGFCMPHHLALLMFHS